MNRNNGFFQLTLKEDGTYLKIFGTELAGQPALYDEICNYLYDVRIIDFDKHAIGRAIASSKDTIELKLTSYQILPQDEFLKIHISADRMQAIGRFYPPSDQGRLMTKEDIVGVLVRNNVRYGVDEESINLFLKDRRYCEDYILAKGLLPNHGRDAFITYHFNTDVSRKPKTNEDGSVDFHQLEMFSTCKRDELLATLTPMDLGKPGLDIMGSVIRPNKTMNKILRGGNKVYLSEDGLQMFSKVDGHVSLTDDRVFVSDIYEVAADVSSATGDILYDGNVIIKGNVITGFTVRAKGNIEVNGVVEGAVLEAGGNIILRRGMQGMNRGLLKAEGNVVSKFIENAEVIAGGYISTECILHSRISARGDIIVGGKRGFVTGGEIRSGSMISVKTAGSQMGTTTLLEVGIDPRRLESFREMEKQIATLQGEKEKIVQALAVFQKRISAGNTIPPDKREFIQQLVQNSVKIDTQLKELSKQYDEYKIEVDSKEDGVIKVSGIVYPGTKIVISNVIHFVRTETHHSRFIRDRADIKVTAL